MIDPALRDDLFKLAHRMIDAGKEGYKTTPVCWTMNFTISYDPSKMIYLGHALQHLLNKDLEAEWKARNIR